MVKNHRDSHRIFTERIHLLKNIQNEAPPIFTYIYYVCFFLCVYYICKFSFVLHSFGFVWLWLLLLCIYLLSIRVVSKINLLFLLDRCRLYWRCKLILFYFLIVKRLFIFIFDLLSLDLNEEYFTILIWAKILFGTN